MWGMHVDYITSATGHTYMVWQAYLFKAYANNVNVCMLVLVMTLLVVVSSYKVFI